MVIKDIQHIDTFETRRDGRYPRRIGSTVTPVFAFTEGKSAVLSYETDNEGNPKDGYLCTSVVTSVCVQDDTVTLDTLNSRYIFGMC